MKLPARQPAIRTSALLRGAQRRRLLKLFGLHALTGPAAAGQAALWAALPTQACAASPAISSWGNPPWRPDHTVIVVLENLSAYDATAGQRKGGHAPVYAPTSDWRFLNELAEGGARCTQSTFTSTPYGSRLPTRPSQPNYLYLFSGHHQGVLPAWFEDERSPYAGTALRDRQGRLLSEAMTTRVGVGNNQIPDAWLPFASPNLGAAILQTGGTFASFSESLPYPSWNCGTDSSVVPCNANFAFTDDYRRKHNPAVNWMDLRAPGSPRGREGDPSRHLLPVAANLAFDPSFDPVLKQGFRGFARDAQGKPLGFETLPTVSIVVPNDQHNAHSNAAKVADDWLRQHIGPYAQWARRHNSLLIVTFDEDGSTDASQGDAYMAGQHRIATVFYGAGIKPGVCEQRMDHLNVLSTVLWLHGALDRFRADFRRHHAVVDESGSEAEREWLNLQPVTTLFERPAQRPPTKASAGSPA
ncbi:MAG: alkaline phosphatase family protein [Aquabacterium sp.]